jgi:surface protein
LTIDILSEGKSNYIFTNCKKSKKYLNSSEKIKNKNKNKKDKSFSKKNRINFTFAIYLIKYIIINYLVINVLAFNNYHFFKLNFQKIKLRIKKSGKQMKIYHEYSGYNAPQPQYVYINGRRYTPSNYMDLTASDNFIEIIWPDNFNYFSRRFCNSEMDEIDLSDFDTSQVVDMEDMLSNCQSLTSFVMSKYGTKNLKKLNRLFKGCSSLTSLDLTDFDMSNVEEMGSMFYECTKLQTINLNNFNGNKLTYYNDIFYKVPDNVIVCIQDIPNNRKLLDLLQNKPGFIKGNVYNHHIL